MEIHVIIANKQKEIHKNAKKKLSLVLKMLQDCTRLHLVYIHVENRVIRFQNTMEVIHERSYIIENL